MKIKNFKQIFEGIQDGKEIETTLLNSPEGKDLMAIMGEKRKQNEQIIEGTKYSIQNDGDVVLIFPPLRPYIKKSVDRNKPIEESDIKWSPRKYIVTKYGDYWCFKKGSNLILRELDLPNLFRKIWEKMAIDICFMMLPGRKDQGLSKFIRDTPRIEGKGLNPWEIVREYQSNGYYFPGYRIYNGTEFFDEKKYIDIFKMLDIKYYISEYDYGSNNNGVIYMTVSPGSGPLKEIWRKLVKEYLQTLEADPRAFELTIWNNGSRYSKNQLTGNRSSFQGDIGQYQLTLCAETKDELENEIFDALKKIVKKDPIYNEGKASNSPFNRLILAILGGSDIKDLANIFTWLAKKQDNPYEFYKELKKIPNLWPFILKIEPEADEYSQAGEWGL